MKIPPIIWTKSMIQMSHNLLVNNKIRFGLFKMIWRTKDSLVFYDFFFSLINIGSSTNRNILRKLSFLSKVFFSLIKIKWNIIFSLSDVNRTALISTKLLFIKQNKKMSYKRKIFLHFSFVISHWYDLKIVI